MRYWGDIELPDEDELAELEALADLRRVDAPSQPESERDEEWMLILCQTRKKRAHHQSCALPFRPCCSHIFVAMSIAGWP
jgi:hypothetical protein